MKSTKTKRFKVWVSGLYTKVELNGQKAYAKYTDDTLTDWKLFRKLKDCTEKQIWEDLNESKIDYQIVRVIDSTIIARFLEEESACSFKKGDDIVVLGASEAFLYNTKTGKSKKVKEDISELGPVWLPTLHPAILKTIAKELGENLENIKHETAKVNLND
jgi:hypothetical protein